VQGSSGLVLEDSTVYEKSTSVKYPGQVTGEESDDRWFILNTLQ
jgi:hypothetical protein